MKTLYFLIVGSMAAVVLLGAGCVKRTSPSLIENTHTQPNSQTPGTAYRDAEGNIVVPSANSGTIMTAPSSSLPNSQPLEIGPDGKGPTSTQATSH